MARARGVAPVFRSGNAALDELYLNGYIFYGRDVSKADLGREFPEGSAGVPGGGSEGDRNRPVLG